MSGYAGFNLVHTLVYLREHEYTNGSLTKDNSHTCSSVCESLLVCSYSNVHTTLLPDPRDPT